MKKAIASASRTKEILDTYDLYPKKGWGQNFLIDTSVAKKIATSMNPNGAVIEVGPGIGGLSEQLLQQVAHVKAFEIDPRFIDVLTHELEEYPNFELVHQDILEVDLPKELGNLKTRYGSVSVAANLPYYITSPVLFAFFESGVSLEQIVVMVQKEVGERFLAKPNSKEYGALSVEGQYLYKVERVCNVPKNAFFPAPKVDSVVVAFKKKEETQEPINQEDFFAFVKAGFKQRRKTLYNNLREYYGDANRAKEVLEACAFNEKSRAQELSVEAWVQLYRSQL
ncbi:MAG: ribosomal RNA small subunit methyltransferase A [Solobacterium sp.]|nr:ribosomal RNA small subunit methyltransferase A [Solobacterium sp.]